MAAASAIEQDPFTVKPILFGLLALATAVIALCCCGLLPRLFVVSLLLMAFAFDILRHLHAFRLNRDGATALGGIVLLAGLIGMLRWPVDIHFWLVRPIYQMQVSALPEADKVKWHSGWDGGLGYDVSAYYQQDASRGDSEEDGEAGCKIIRHHLGGHFYLLETYC